MSDFLFSIGLYVLILFWIYSRTKQLRAYEYQEFKRRIPKAFIFIIPMAIALFLASFITEYFINIQYLFINNHGQFIFLESEPLLFWFITIVLSAIAEPFIDELIFRGFIYNNMIRTGSTRLRASLISSTIYGLLPVLFYVVFNLSGFDFGHVVILFVYGFSIGMASCFVYEKTHSLYSSIFMHMIFKSIFMVYLLFLYL